MTNAERQRQFKARMRAKGKRQITLWATPEQARALRAYLFKLDNQARSPAKGSN